MKPAIERLRRLSTLAALVGVVAIAYVQHCAGVVVVKLFFSVWFIFGESRACIAFLV